jgi:hypothetical protein
MLGRIRSIIAGRITKLSETGDTYEAIYKRTQEAGDSDNFRALASTIRQLRLIMAATPTDPDAPSVPAPPGSSASLATSSPHLGARPFPAERRGKRQRQSQLELRLPLTARSPPAPISHSPGWHCTMLTSLRVPMSG